MILLVEDDELVRELLLGFLEVAGYQVMAAATGEEALRAVAPEAIDLDLAVVDISLPGIGGVEVARRLRSTRPELKIIYMSGNPTEHERATAGAVGVAGLSKPFARDALLNTVRRLTAADGTG